jgi:hypothetical protein
MYYEMPEAVSPPPDCQSEPTIAECDIQKQQLELMEADIPDDRRQRRGDSLWYELDYLVIFLC